MLLSALTIPLFTSYLPAGLFPTLPPALSTSIPSSKLLSSNTTASIDALRLKYAVPGITLSVSNNVTNITENISFGIANAKGDPVTEKVRPVTDLEAGPLKIRTQSFFSIASNSKFFTTLAVGMLIENDTVLPNGEKLDWSTKIKDILPDWKLMDEYASEHTDVIDLMST